MHGLDAKPFFVGIEAQAGDGGLVAPLLSQLSEGLLEKLFGDEIRRQDHQLRSGHGQRGFRLFDALSRREKPLLASVVSTSTPGTIGEAPGQLYNLRDDPGEQQNLYLDRPEIVQRLTELIVRHRNADRSVVRSGAEHAPR